MWQRGDGGKAAESEGRGLWRAGPGAAGGEREPGVGLPGEAQRRRCQEKGVRERGTGLLLCCCVSARGLGESLCAWQHCAESFCCMPELSKS